MSKNSISPLILAVAISLLLSGCHRQNSSQHGHTSGSRCTIDANIDSLAMNCPYQSLAMIDSAAETGDLTPFMAMKHRAMIYYNPLQEDSKAIECASKALSMKTGELDYRNRITLLSLLAKCHYLTGNFDESIRYAVEGVKQAEAADSLAAKAEFKFIAGECMVQIGQASAGFADMEYAVTIMSRQKDVKARTRLSHMLGDEMNFLIESGRVAEALETGRRREEILDGIEREYGASGSYLDQQFAYLYGKMAQLFVKAGDREKADEYAAKFYGTEYSKDANGRLRILEYLVESGRSREALELIGDTDFPSPGDTVSPDGCYYLKLKAEAMGATGDFEKAYSLLRRSCAISDSVDSRIDKEKANSALSAYRRHEAELKAKEAEARRARLSLVMLIIVATCIILVLMSLMYYHKTRGLVEKNRLITIGKSDAEKYMRLLRSAQARIKELSGEEDVEGKASEADSWQLFLKLEDAMDKQHLYLDKGITRADILDLLGISKNRLGKMFQDIGGDLSLPSYINGKRLNHALGVIAEHPEYTVNEIADASGFSNTRNFHLLFKKRFGITPLQYRDGK